MAISTLDAYRKAAKQNVAIYKGLWPNFGSGPLVASGWTVAGTPGAGAGNPSNTANGVVPDNTTTGAASIANFSGTGYLTRAECHLAAGPLSAATYGFLSVYDRLWHAGAYSFNSNVTLSAQPSYSGRLPTVGGNPDYTGLEIWIENASNFTGTLNVVVTYTDQDGNTGHSTGTVTNSNTTNTLMTRCPLAAGDVGVRKIESVVASVATVGTFNVLVVRPLWRWITPFMSMDQLYAKPRWLDQTMMPVVFPTSCLATKYHYAAGSGAGSLATDFQLEIASA